MPNKTGVPRYHGPLIYPFSVVFTRSCSLNVRARARVGLGLVSGFVLGFGFGELDVAVFHTESFLFYSFITSRCLFVSGGNILGEDIKGPSFQCVLSL